jgi:hypothetical protein
MEYGVLFRDRKVLKLDNVVFRGITMHHSAKWHFYETFLGFLGILVKNHVTYVS